MPPSPGLTFATPLPQSARSEILEWRFPKPYNGYVLTGRSRAAWHTSFVIPQLNLLLDAGLCVNKLRPKHVFLTHGHSDHTLLAPAFVKREDPPDIFCPAEMARVFDDFILANTMLNLGGLVGEKDSPPPLGAPDTDDEGSAAVAPAAADKGWMNTHATHGLRPGDTVPLRRAKGVSATAFACDHTVPCLGYVFSSTTHKLRPEYAGLPGAELAALRRGGRQLTAAATAPVFAFLGDTTAATLAAEPEWLRAGVPVVITECSFLYAEHAAQAAKTKHTVWGELEPVVRRFPRTVFVLMHFSLRYSDGDVRRFFKQMEDPPGNVVVWVDGLDDAEAGGE
jgi:ribonuclease Z